MKRGEQDRDSTNKIDELKTPVILRVKKIIQDRQIQKHSIQSKMCFTGSLILLFFVYTK